MVARIIINCDNESFRLSTREELERILKDLAFRLKEKNEECPMILRDNEGSIVGFFDFSPF